MISYPPFSFSPSIESLLLATYYQRGDIVAFKDVFRKSIKMLIPGVSWRHPLVRIWLRLMTPLDWLARKIRGIEHLPPYPIRARSTGLRDQFGGRRFHELGLRLATFLTEHAGLGKGSKVLEIGCGCGRNAFTIATVAPEAEYTGVDVDRSSVEWCRSNRYFADLGYEFEFLDIQNDEYNPDGEHPANEYRFPYDDDTFDIVFLISVFTHMLTPEVQNYVREIARILRPGGTCVVSVLLVDEKEKAERSAFPYRESAHYYAYPAIPELKIGYEEPFLREVFEEEGMEPTTAPILGSWRSTEAAVRDKFDQDLLIFRRSHDDA